MSSLRKHVGLYVLFAIVLSLFAALVAVQPAHAAPAVSGPVAKAWYFSEGRIGSGFKTFYTIGNPSGTACAVKVQYAYVLDGSTLNQSKTVSYTVAPNSRYTVNANADVPVSTPATLSATISVDNATPTCTGIVVERPVEFQNFHGNSSGTDVLGATTLSQAWNFADVPTHSAGESFLAVLNPGDNTANVTANYYANGALVGSIATLAVAPHSRATFQPNNDVNLPAHVAAVVISDRDVLVERPAYFTNEYGVSGAADVVGAPVPAPSWTFAEGNTASGTQENIAIANVGDTDATATVTLSSLNGNTWTSDPISIPKHSQYIFNVNANNMFAGATAEVAAKVVAADEASKLVAQRQLFTKHSGPDGWSAQGVSDTLGASDLHPGYSFAEGFTSVRYDEALALYNPQNAPLDVAVTVSNMLGHSYTQTSTVPAQGRYTVNITQLVKDHLVSVGEDSRAYAISMSVSAGSGFVAERSMYYHTPAPFEVQSTNSVVGYAG